MTILVFAQDPHPIKNVEFLAWRRKILLKLWVLCPEVLCQRKLLSSKLLFIYWNDICLAENLIEIFAVDQIIICTALSSSLMFSGILESLLIFTFERFYDFLKPIIDIARYALL